MTQGNLRFKSNLESILRELVWYFNRLFLESIIYGSDRKQNPIFKDRGSIIQLMQEKSKEPGLTVEDIAGFNESVTEDYADFVDRFSEFFIEYGIELVYYDTLDSYIFVNDPKKYRILLEDIESIEDQVLKRALVQKIDCGLEHSVNLAYKSSNHLLGYEEEDDVVDSKWGELFRSIPTLLEYHNKIDPNPPESNIQIRKRLCLSIEAYENNFLRPFSYLKGFLNVEEVGNISSLHMFVDVSDFPKNGHIPTCIVMWISGLQRVRATINIFGLRAEPIIKKVLNNLAMALDVFEKKAHSLDESYLKEKEYFLDFIVYFKNELSELSEIKLEEKIFPKIYIPKKAKTSEEKMDEIIINIKSCFFTQKELKVLAQKVKNLKAKNANDLPF